MIAVAACFTAKQCTARNGNTEIVKASLTAAAIAAKCLRGCAGQKTLGLAHISHRVTAAMPKDFNRTNQMT
jgi:hypothetical protein